MQSLKNVGGTYTCRASKGKVQIADCFESPCRHIVLFQLQSCAELHKVEARILNNIIPQPLLTNYKVSTALCRGVCEKTTQRHGTPSGGMESLLLLRIAQEFY